MNWVALKMLTGDRSKYLGIIFGVTFATLLMAQQMSIFSGLMRRTGSQILDVGEADIWVMDPRVRFIDEVPALPEDTLQRVRGVAGVAWAVQLYKGNVRCRLADGNFRNAILFGLDDATLVGAPPKMLAGTLADLRSPDAVIMDEAGYEYLWPEDKATIKTEAQARQAVRDERPPGGDRRHLQGVAAVPVHADPLHPLQPGDAVRAAGAEAAVVRAGQGGRRRRRRQTVCQRIEAATQANRPGDDDRRLLALTGDQFFWKTIGYFMGSTGIPINFGITVLLGFVVGAAIAGQTFYLFTIENLKQFGSLKAMGVTNRRIVGMILLQAPVVGVLGYGLGVGPAAPSSRRSAGRRSSWPGFTCIARWRCWWPGACRSSACWRACSASAGCWCWSRRSSSAAECCASRECVSRP